jgi:Flp pilus assembly protein TadG
MAFGLVAAPLLIAVGVSLDYARALNVRSKMQADLDAALIAGIRESDSLTEDKIKAKVVEWFDAQKDGSSARYTFSATTITVNKTDRTIEAKASGTVPTTILGIANIDSLDVAVKSSVSGPATSYLDVYIVLDKSASMLLAATKSGQDSLIGKTGCTFACHEIEGGPWSVKGVSYDTHYKVAKALGVTLRADVSVTAAKEVLTLIDLADPKHQHIRVGLVKVGATATQVLAPTFSTSTALSTLTNDSGGLTGATSETTSKFTVSLPALTKLVGSAGDGTSASTPMKLVLLLTDGVQSQRSWVIDNPSNQWKCVSTVNGNCIKFNTNYFPDQPKVKPFEPSLCKDMKKAGATLGVLYTEYLPIPLDWGYNGTVGETMKTSTFSDALRTGVSKTTARRDYIPYALEDCATSSEMFLSAADPQEIEDGLASLFSQYLGSVRLTQ